jgi:hypothetical protein
MGGFSTNPTSYEDTYQNIRYGLYVQNGFLEIYENGGQATVPGSMTNLSTDIWKVEYDGTNVKYYKNSSLIYTSPNPVTQPLHIFFALLTPNEGVTDVCVIGTPDPLPTPTPTPTATSTPTPTPTESPLDFEISGTCVDDGAVSTHHYTGGSGFYDRGNGLYDTELEALNETQWSTVLNPNGYVGYGLPISNITKTYCVAMRDRNNQSNIIAKSILVDCAPTPTPTSTPTPTPTPTAEPSGLIVTILEVGSNVIMSGSGSLNVTGLIEGSVQTAGGVNGTLGYWVIGQSNLFFARKFFGNNLNVYPNSFGSGYTAPTSYSGQTFGIQDGSLGKDIILPIGYTSGSPLSGTATFANKTISSMGLTPGTYLYDWGSDSITLQIGS